jgi:hypothetical protein
LDDSANKIGGEVDNPDCEVILQKLSILQGTWRSGCMTCVEFSEESLKD